VQGCRYGRDREKEDAITPTKFGAGSGRSPQRRVGIVEKSSGVIVLVANEVRTDTTQVSQARKD